MKTLLPVEARIPAASEEIRSVTLRASIERARRARFEQPIRVIDLLLDELERFNLDGGRRVPHSWEPRLDHLKQLLPVKIDADLRARVAPRRLMDSLFELQDVLLDLKVPGRSRLREVDAEIFGDSDRESADTEAA